MVGSFNTPLSVPGRSSRQKLKQKHEQSYQVLVKNTEKSGQRES